MYPSRCHSFFLLGLLALSHGCEFGEPQVSGPAPMPPSSTPVLGDTPTDAMIYKNSQLCSSSGGTANCTAKLAGTQSSPDNTCADSSTLHWWPIDGPATDCHGWTATDTTGKVHQNSADSIMCSCDGKTMTYTQYPDSLDCSGIAHPKSFTLDQCNQGLPPTLWDRAVDLSCCTPSDDCVTALEEDVAPQKDWLQNGVYYKPPLAEQDKKYFITIGMSDQTDCSNIGNRTILTLYVGPNTTDTCQGWNHYLNPYPDTSSVHQNSAINVKCVDGGVEYTQYTNIDCSGSWATNKTDLYEQCHQGMPPTVYTEVLDFSGCLAQGFKPTALPAAVA